MPVPSSVLARAVPVVEGSGASTGRSSLSPVVAVITLFAALMAVLAVVGGDARWLAAAGADIIRRGGLSDSVPYALAPSTGWHNVPALAEVIAYAATLLSDQGLLLLHIAAVTAGLVMVARDASTGRASRGSTALVLVVVVLGAFPTLFVMRLQLFSLLLFPVLVALLRAEARRPSSRVWWLPVLLALWGNLHGAVLLGLAVTLTYLLFSRARSQPVLALAVSGVSGLALLLTPSGLDTIDYYLGVAENEAAQQHVGLWARLSLNNPFDIVLVTAAVVLVLFFLSSRPALWERLAALGLAVAVLLAARNGVWLLLFLAPTAARAVPTPTWRHRRLVSTGTALAAVTLACVAVVRGPTDFGASPRLVALTVEASADCGVYAQDALGEQVVQAGGRVWITNPLDTFSLEEQRRFVRWSQTGDLEQIPAAVSALLVIPGGQPDEALRRSDRYAVAAQDRTAVLHVRKHGCTVGA